MTDLWPKAASSGRLIPGRVIPGRVIPGRLIPEGRRREILAVLEQQQRLTVEGLAASLAVSKETIRGERPETLLADRRLLRKPRSPL